MTAKFGPGDAVLAGPSCVSIERSGEFLSCAKTALKIGKNQHKQDPQPPPPNAWWLVAPSTLRLLDTTTVSETRTKQVLEYGLTLLETMETELKQLEGLVRRRGQSNDPTQAIAASTQRLEWDTQELTQWLPTVIPSTIRRNGHAFEHYSMIQKWFQQATNDKGKRLQEILKVRGKVLADQARRRKQFQASSETRTSSHQNKPLNDVDNNPLFQLTPLSATKPTQGQLSTSSLTTNSGVAVTSQAARQTPAAATGTLRPSTGPVGSNGYAYYPSKTGGYAGSSSLYATNGGGYGGGIGMRQRRPLGGATASFTPHAQQQQEQEQALLLQRQENRKTQMRLQEAREAEKGLASLVGLFGQMSTLISEQSEVIDKIEDDVEAAAVDVQKGQNTITDVYSLKKGNRPLIIKVFATLIFVIIFMRFYKG